MIYYSLWNQTKKYLIKNGIPLTGIQLSIAYLRYKNGYLKQRKKETIEKSIVYVDYWLMIKGVYYIALILLQREIKVKKTAGIDGMIINEDYERMALFYKLSDYKISLHNPKPVRRIYIPKKNGKTRPLGIPSIIDRVYQEVCKLALEPMFEAKFESSTYGFRPCRGTSDAIEKIHTFTRGLKRTYIFEGDFVRQEVSLSSF